MAGTTPLRFLYARRLPRLACASAGVGERGCFVGVVRAVGPVLTAPISLVPSVMVRVTRTRPLGDTVGGVLAGAGRPEPRDELERALDFALEDETGTLAVNARLSTLLMSAHRAVTLEQIFDDIDRLRAGAHLTPVQLSEQFPEPKKVFDLSSLDYRRQMPPPHVTYTEYCLPANLRVVIVGSVQPATDGASSDAAPGYRAPSGARVLGTTSDAFALYVADALDDVGPAAPAAGRA